MASTKKKYTYNDWYTAKVNLIYSPYTWKKSYKPIFIEWDSIAENEIEIIKGKQKEIFEEKVKYFLENKKNTFKKKLLNSKLEKHLLKRELLVAKSIIFGSGVSVNGITTDNLRDIRSYIDIVKLNGVEIGYDFVYSPNCEIKRSEIEQSEIWAEALFQYYLWLLSLKPKPREQNINNESEIEQISKSSPKYDTGIFISETGFQIFLGYIGELENYVKKHPLIHLSYIYWCLKEDGFLSISVRPSVWMEFLSKDSMNYNLSKVKTKEQSYSDIRAAAYSKIKKKLLSNLIRT
jgi:hypothetical protein